MSSAQTGNYADAGVKIMTIKRKFVSAAIAGSLLMLTACGDKQEDAEEVIRPVLFITAKTEPSQQIGFAGSVEPQYRTDLAFRVMGRLIQRHVDIGDMVEKDQVVAMIDPAQLDLNLQAAKADMASAQAQFVNAQATEDRQSRLLATRSISQALYDNAKQARDTAAAGLEKAKAALRKAEDERDFAQLQPDFAGVVSAVNAEVGQVVAAGQSVITVARPDVREAVVDVPDSIAEEVTAGDKFMIFLQADPIVQTEGHVREIAPQADSATRLRRVKITLDEAPEAFRLGTTITALRSNGDHAEQIRLPLSALLEQDGKTYVWIADAQSQTVRRQSVEVMSRTDHDFVGQGVKAGQHIVSAGVNSLQDGQKVKLPQGEK